MAEALKAFHQAGAAAGDIGFWRKHVAHFNSPKAYALVVGALWQKPDLVAAMALLMQWLSQAGLIPLKQGEYSFHALAQRWLSEVCQTSRPGRLPLDQSPTSGKRWFANSSSCSKPTPRISGKFPRSTCWGSLRGPPTDEELDADDADERSRATMAGLFSAAYDDVVYIDSTGDGVEADMLESGARRRPPISSWSRKAAASASGWRSCAPWLRCGKRPSWPAAPESPRRSAAETLERWLEQAADNERRLLALLRAVDERRIPAPSSSRDSLLEFDRRRGVKESLVDKIIGTAIETADAARSMRATLPAGANRRRTTCRSSTTCCAPSCAATRRACNSVWPRLLESSARSRCCTCRWPRAAIRPAWPRPACCNRRCAICWSGCRGWDCCEKPAS